MKRERNKYKRDVTDPDIVICEDREPLCEEK
jgi:hypothetical protein